MNRIVVVSDSQFRREEFMIRKVCEEKGIPYAMFNIEQDSLEAMSTDRSVIFVRGMVKNRLNWLNKITDLERAGHIMVNKREVLELCNDKYRTYGRLKDFGLTQPRTLCVAGMHESIIKEQIRHAGFEYPMILKTLEGSYGIGVALLETENSVISVAQTLYDKKEDMVLQEYIPTDVDYRAHIVDDEVIGCMAKYATDGDFRTNYSRGATVQESFITPLEEEHCKRATRACGTRWGAVDFIPSKNRDIEPPYILEVNHAPQTEGIETALAGNRELGDRTNPLINKLVDYFVSIEK